MSFNSQLENNFNVDISEEIKEPSRYKVIFYNDDFTTKEFVEEVLIQIFHKSTSEASNLTESIHKTGSAVVGIYIYDIAYTLSQLTIANARENGFPLRCEVEEE